MPDGAVVIAAVASGTNTSNPRSVIAAGLLAKKANRLGLVRKPWVKTSLAPGSKAVELYLKETGLLHELEMLGFDMVRNDDGSVRAGSLARAEPEGRGMRMWEAIETYLTRHQPLIVIAGTDCGQGSSRDWAAKVVRLVGVEVLVAEGFERIYRTNLIGMGVLPLESQPGTSRLTLGLDGTEIFDVIGERTPQAVLTLSIRHKNSETASVPVKCRLDTAEEASVYEAGGLLQRFAQDFLAARKAA